MTLNAAPIAMCEVEIASKVPTEGVSATYCMLPAHFVPTRPAPIVVGSNFRSKAGSKAVAVDTHAIVMRKGANTKGPIEQVPVMTSHPIPPAPSPIMVGPNSVDPS